MGGFNSRPAVIVPKNEKVREEIKHETPKVEQKQPVVVDEKPTEQKENELVGVKEDGSLAPGWFEVETILSHRVLPHNKVEYLIKWKGYDSYVDLIYLCLTNLKNSINKKICF